MQLRRWISGFLCCCGIMWLCSVPVWAASSAWVALSVCIDRAVSVLEAYTDSGASCYDSRTDAMPGQFGYDAYAYVLVCLSNAWAVDQYASDQVVLQARYLLDQAVDDFLASQIPESGVISDVSMAYAGSLLASVRPAFDLYDDIALAAPGQYAASAYRALEAAVLSIRSDEVTSGSAAWLQSACMEFLASYHQPPADGWVGADTSWKYYRSGHPVTGWATINGADYFFSDSGLLSSGWQRISGIEYYFIARPGAEFGKLATGWQFVDNHWYLFSAAGMRLSGWQLVDGRWYYLAPDTGRMLTHWQWISGAWYFLAPGSGHWIP